MYFTQNFLCRNQKAESEGHMEKVKKVSWNIIPPLPCE